MPYILGLLAVLLAVFGLYQLMVNASARQVRALILAAGTLGVAMAVFLLALSGRLPAILGLFAGLAPFAVAIWQNKGRERPTDRLKPSDLSREEALNILGLTGDPDKAAIQDAYRRLMKPMHPDQKGSPWVAERLNAARDRLLKAPKKPRKP